MSGNNELAASAVKKLPRDCEQTSEILVLRVLMPISSFSMNLFGYFGIFQEILASSWEKSGSDSR